jgi:hypothetical protein
LFYALLLKDKTKKGNLPPLPSTFVLSLRPSSKRKAEEEDEEDEEGGCFL